jgi:glycosyltransferase involved in cell wall biosynthesis
MTIKVLHLIDSGGLYGAEKMLLALVAEQLKLGLQPMILSAGEPGIQEKAIEAEARRLGLPVIPWRMKPGFNLRDSLAIIRWARAEGYQLLHSHGYKFNVLIGLWPESIRKIPLVATVHGYVKAPRFSKSWIYETLDRLVLRQMRCVVLVAEAMTREVPKSIVASGKTAVIANGLEIEHLEQVASEPVSGELCSTVERHQPVLLGVGRLSHEKGFDRLIEAFKTVKGTYAEAGLIVIGEGRYRKRLEQQAADLGLNDSVYLPGYYDNVPALMARSDLLCMPSRTEGLPITLLEAMAVGVPICASDVGEIRAVLGDGRGGTVSDFASAKDLAADILHSLEKKEQMAEAVEWSRQRVRQIYSARNMAQQYLDVYQKALG